MSEGAFWSSFDESIAILKKLGMLKEENRHKDLDYSEECKDYSRSGNYGKIYQNLVDNRDFDILLYDDSMLQMSLTSGESRLLFIQNPLEFLPFETFLTENGFDYDSESIDELRGILIDEYEKACEMMKINSGAVYMRYDVDLKGRKNNDNIHAYTHLHIGLNNNIRIPIGMHLTPLAFTYFIIRHVYYDTWIEAIRTSKIDMDYKRRCEDLPAELWTEAEKKLMYMS